MEEYFERKGTKKNSILGWIVTLGEILTIDNLRKVEKLLWIDAVCLRIVDRCFMSKNCGESVDHLLYVAMWLINCGC